MKSAQALPRAARVTVTLVCMYSQIRVDDKGIHNKFGMFLVLQFRTTESTLDFFIPNGFEVQQRRVLRLSEVTGK